VPWRIREYDGADRETWLRLHAGWGATPRQLVEASLDTEPTDTDIVVRLVAEDGRRVVGCAELNEALPGFAGRSVLRVVVDPQQRGQGIGSELSAQLLAASAGRPRVLRVVVRDNDPGARRFVERRGFRLVQHSLGFVLDLEAVPPRAPEPEPGLDIWALPDAPCDADWVRLHDAFVACCADTPDLEGVMPPRDFLEALVTLPAGALVGHVDGRVAAFTAAYPEDAQTWRIALTGVAPALRRRGLGRTIKLALEQVARRHGARRITTDNLSDNRPILALNRSLGYVAGLGTWRLEL